jgi:enoyl-CoA hydratase
LWQVVPADKLMSLAHTMATKIASMSRPIAIMCKESVNSSFETTLATGMQYERKLFHATFALKDRAEGMTAFAEKRPAKFVHG